MGDVLKHCQFFVKRKKRYCRMTVKEGRTYCGEHMVTAPGNIDSKDLKLYQKRIRCPIDNSHTCDELKLAKHLKVCNAKRLIDAKPDYIVDGMNRGEVKLTSPRQVPLLNFDQSVIDSIIEKVKIAHGTLPEIDELILQHQRLDAEIDNSTYGNNTKKHLIQNSSLLGHLVRAKLIQDDTCFIEFGAGKGKLTYWLAKIIENDVKGSTILLIDRSSHRNKNDNKLRNKQCGVNLIRIRADIADLCLSKVEVVKSSKHKVGIAKHLCGAGTDLTIRCLEQATKDHSKIDGLVMAFCCHHRCEYSSYVGKQYLTYWGFLPEEFPILCKIASWATCGTGKNREESLHNRTPIDCQRLDEREMIGRKVKALLNWGRVKYLHTIGFDSHLYYYTKPEVSLENMCVVAVHSTTGRSASSSSDDSGGRGSSSSNNSNTRSGIITGSCDGLERRMLDITRDKPIKVAVRVKVPVQDHPKFNFVGKLLGPKGNSLKRLQEESGCKMAVLGRGSMKDRRKEEELRVGGDPKFAHLRDDLHVEISAYATPAEAHARIAYSLVEIRRFLVPDYNDDIRREQMWEIQMLNRSKRDSNPQHAPPNPETSFEPTGSPILSIPCHSVAVSAPAVAAHDQESSNESSSQSNVYPVSTTVNGRKRPLVSSKRPTMSPTKRTVMSLLARARAAQNKEHQIPQVVPNQSLSTAVAGIHQGTLTMLAQSTCQAAIVPTCQRLQLVGSSTVIPAQCATVRQQSIMSGNPPHQILSPAIHGLIHTPRDAAGPLTILPVSREDLVAKVNLV